MYICLHVGVNVVSHIEEKHRLVAFDNRIVGSRRLGKITL
jgi:hypothetical protein